MSTALLEIQNLSVEFRTRRGPVRAVDGVSLTLARQEIVGIVGESGSGKSVTCYALMRLLDQAGRIADGAMRFSNIDLLAASEGEMRELRGSEISMIFQNPRAALNPIRPIGRQIEDVLLEHLQVTSKAEARGRAIEMLELVRIARPEERTHAYPFELSGGMCQRVVIALALACQPQLLIADEPTTGLDVTTQKAIMDLVVDLTRSRGMSTILITHDLGLASAYCDRLYVMQRGVVVESAPATGLFTRPEHPYTRRLMQATPRPGIGIRDLLPDRAPSARQDTAMALSTSAQRPLLTVDNLLKEYPLKGQMRASAGSTPGVFRAVDDVSFSIAAGECVGLVGESGCGKSTTSAMIMRLLDPTGGHIRFEGEDIGAIPAKRFAHAPKRARLQMVFQDPTDSLNPRFTALRSIVDPLLRLGGVQRNDEARARAEDLARLVGLPAELLDRFPHQLSGGQKARVGIARAIALHPSLLVLDEPTAALDVSVQAVVLNLLVDLKAELGMSYLFVSHDLHVVGLLCDRVIVMRSGRIVEQGPAEAVLADPQAAYTKDLIAAIPTPPVPH
jgi:peptide/nickel transport system ATP-binding protein